MMTVRSNGAVAVAPLKVRFRPVDSSPNLSVVVLGSTGTLVVSLRPRASVAVRLGSSSDG
jgi:hypothetical protein